MCRMIANQKACHHKPVDAHGAKARRQLVPCVLPVHLHGLKHRKVAQVDDDFLADMGCKHYPIAAGHHAGLAG